MPSDTCDLGSAMEPGTLELIADVLNLFLCRASVHFTVMLLLPEYTEERTENFTAGKFTRTAVFGSCESGHRLFLS